jgi:Tfp pilus assembly protein PilF
VCSSDLLKKDAYDKVDKLVVELESKAKAAGATADDLVQLGFARIGLQEYGDAETALKEALKKKKDYYYAYYGLGYSFEKAGNKKEAKSNYEKALKAEPEYEAAKVALKRIELGVEEGGVIIKK